jgi:hypothetical protein
MLISIKRIVILATVLAAATFPAVASARPVGPDHPYLVASPVAQTAAPAHLVSPASTSGFKWHDAAFGAAAMLILVGIGTGATLAVRRRSAILS